MAARIALWACIAYLAGWPSAKADAQTSTTFQIDPAHSGAVITSQPFAPPLRSLWSVNLKGAVSYPVFAGDEIIVNVRTPGFNGVRMVALSPSTGHTIWQKYIAADSNTVFAATDNNIVFELNDEGILQAFYPETGARKWILDVPNAASIETPLIASNGYIYVVTNNSSSIVYKISEATGEIVWAQSINSVPSFALDEKNIYLVGSCDIYSINVATSQSNWHLNPSCSGGSNTIPTALYKNLIFATNYGPQGVIVDSRTGAIKDKYVSPGVPAFYDNIMIAAQYGGNISANELLSRHVIWNFQPTNDSVSAPPIVVNSTVYAVSDNGMLYALDASTGKSLQALTLLGTSPDGAGIYSGLGFNNNILVAPSGNFLTALTPEATTSMTTSKNKSP